MLRNLLMMLMFAASLVHAAWTDYEETRDLDLDAEGIRTLQIEAGAGSLDVTGVARTSTITVEALISVPDADEDEAREVIREHMVLSLEGDGDNAVLTSRFENGARLFDSSPHIDLQVELPEGMALEIEDGSGSIRVSNVGGDIVVDDGSGSIKMTDVGGALNIKDGSGSITIDGAAGDVTIDDGSGSVTVAAVGGTVTIDDGSGSIDVSTVAGDLIIPDDGSGSVDYRGIEGRVEQGH